MSFLIYQDMSKVAKKKKNLDLYNFDEIAVEDNSKAKVFNKKKIKTLGEIQSKYQGHFA